MIEATPPVWRDFQQLANDYPDCGAVKLTLELQRWFISVQERHFLARVAEAVDSLKRRELSS
jgi:hypothetical protein